MYAKSSGADFEPAPAGLCNAVCVDVVDAGQKPDMNGNLKDKVRLVFQTDKKLSTGKPALVSRQFTLSAHEKAGLRIFCESWRGKPYTTTREFEMFDLERLIGQSATINVVHNNKEGKVFANISVVLPPQAKVTPDGSYTRKKDRPADNYNGPAPKPTRTPAAPRAEDPLLPAGEDDDQLVPF